MVPIRTVQYQNMVFQIGSISTVLLLINGQDPHKRFTTLYLYSNTKWSTPEHKVVNCRWTLMTRNRTLYAAVSSRRWFARTLQQGSTIQGPKTGIAPKLVRRCTCPAIRLVVRWFCLTSWLSHDSYRFSQARRKESGSNNWRRRNIILTYQLASSLLSLIDSTHGRDWILVGQILIHPRSPVRYDLRPRVSFFV